MTSRLRLKRSYQQATLMSKNTSSTAMTKSLCVSINGRNKTCRRPFSNWSSPRSRLCKKEFETCRVFRLTISSWTKHQVCSSLIGLSIQSTFPRLATMLFRLKSIRILTNCNSWLMKIGSELSKKQKTNYRPRKKSISLIKVSHLAPKWWRSITNSSLSLKRKSKKDWRRVSHIFEGRCAKSLACVMPPKSDFTETIQRTCTENKKSRLKHTCGTLRKKSKTRQRLKWNRPLNRSNKSKSFQAPNFLP